VERYPQLVHSIYPVDSHKAVIVWSGA